MSLLFKNNSILFALLILALFSCGRSRSEFSVYPVPETLAVKPGGSYYAALRIEIPDGYYIYGNPKGPGVGKPTMVKMEAPEWIVSKPAQYLEPVRHFQEGENEHTWIYRGETTLFIPFSVKENASPQKLSAAIYLNSLMCNNSECIIKESVIRQQIEIVTPGHESTRYPEEIARLYAASMAPLSHQNEAEISRNDGGGGSFFADSTFHPRMLDRGVTGLIQAILFGLIAGFILNFMPCVLPVVSLKVMSFVQHAGKSDRELKILGLIFSLGILTSFAVLAMLAAFLGYSWGGLFQNRFFIIIMAAVVFAFALSMFDVYMLNIPSFAGKAARKRQNAYADAFVKGLLATLLATPCSGPFLGGTLAWALTRPPGIIIIIFMSIGAGMSFPYLLLTMYPRLISFIPKPGEWARDFERVMGFLLIFTVIYLVSILDKDSIMPAVTFLCFVALGLWQFGRFGAINQSRIKRVISFISLAVILFSGYALSFNWLFVNEEARQVMNSEFSPPRLMENREKGKISMVVFTADWCPNCKLVEKFSLRTPKVEKALADNSVDLMVADITRKNPQASGLLGKLGGRSIPYLAIFPAGKSFGNPICLRDIYSEDDVLRGIGMAREDKAGK